MIDDNYLIHYGKGHLDGGHSGRYPWGSGERPKQRDIVIKKGQEFRTFSPDRKATAPLKYNIISPMSDKRARDDMRDLFNEAEPDFVKNAPRYEVKLQTTNDLKIRSARDVVYDVLHDIRPLSQKDAKEYSDAIKHLEKYDFFELNADERGALFEKLPREKQNELDYAINVVASYPLTMASYPLKNKTIERYAKMGYDGIESFGWLATFTNYDMPISLLNTDKVKVVDSAPNRWASEVFDKGEKPYLRD